MQIVAVEPKISATRSLASQGRTNVTKRRRLNVQVFGMAGDRPNVPNIMIVITDGQDDTDVESQHLLSLAKNIKTYALGVGIGKHLAKFLNALKILQKNREKNN